MKLREARPVVRSGFTLLEVLVVVAILVVIAGVGGVIYMRYLDDAKEKAARLGVQNIEQAVQAFKVSDGDYPETLAVLVQPYEGKPAALELSALKDPWGRDYIYESQNLNPLTGKPRIYSLGPNPGNPQGVIANW
jgi:general secretion pathway protein G